MLALVKRPGQPVERIQLPEHYRVQLDVMQKLCGGYIEIAVRGRDFVVWCDEEGKIKPSPAGVNFHRPTDGDQIIGTVIVTAMRESIDGAICAPLTDESATRIAALLEAWAEAGELCGSDVAHFEGERDAWLRFRPCIGCGDRGFGSAARVYSGVVGPFCSVACRERCASIARSAVKS